MVRGEKERKWWQPRVQRGSECRLCQGRLGPGQPYRGPVPKPTEKIVERGFGVEGATRQEWGTSSSHLQGPMTHTCVTYYSRTTCLPPTSVFASLPFLHWTLNTNLLKGKNPNFMGTRFLLPQGSDRLKIEIRLNYFKSYISCSLK